MHLEMAFSIHFPNVFSCIVYWPIYLFDVQSATYALLLYLSFFPCMLVTSAKNSYVEEGDEAANFIVFPNFFKVVVTQN